MLFQKKKFNTSIFHKGNFSDCPAKEHCHSATIEISSANDLSNFFIDAIVPCETDSITEFLKLLYNECLASGITLKSAELYLQDKQVAYVELFTN